MPTQALGQPVIAVALTLLALQAPGVIRGRVVDGASGLPVPQAVVQAGGGLARTDASGRFALTGIAVGQVQVAVHRVGYGPAGVSLSVVPGAPTEVEIRLAPLPESLEPVNARRGRALGMMTGDEARVRGRTLAEAVDGWAGVVVQQRHSGGPAAPIIRGSAPHEVLVLVDGVPLNDVWTGIADLSRVATAGVEEIRLVPGAQGATYGGQAIAGAILIRTAVRPGLRGAAWTGSYGEVGTGFDGAVSTGNWQLGAQVDLGRSADAYPVSLPATRGGGESRRENAGAEVVRGAVRLQGPIQISARGHLARRGLPGTTVNPSRTGASREAWLTVSGWRGPLLLTIEGLASEASDTSPPLGPAYRSTLHAMGIEGTLRVSGGGFDVEAGGRADRLQGTALVEGTVTARTHLAVARPFARSAGAWRLSAVPTARIDAWTQAGSPAISARLDVRGEREPIGLYAGVGSSASHPILADHLFHEGVAVRPNPDLRPERVVWEVEAGGDTRWQALGWAGVVAVRGFIGRVEDLVLWAPDFRFVWAPANFNVRRSGLDLSASAEAAAARLVLAGSVGVASVQYDRPGAPQVMYRPDHVVAGSAMWRPSPWRLRVAARRIGARFPNHGGVNALAPATVWDASVEREIPLRGATLEVGLSLRDVFDRRLEHVAGQPLAGRTLTLRMELGNQ